MAEVLLIMKMILDIFKLEVFDIFMIFINDIVQFIFQIHRIFFSSYIQRDRMPILSQSCQNYER